MKYLPLLLVLVANATLACGNLPPHEQARKDRDDVARQIELAEALGLAAKSVFIGEVVSVVRVHDAELAKVRVTRVLKGHVPDAAVELEVPKRGLVVACSSADGFHNVWIHSGRTYIFYADDTLLLRAGWVDRSEGDIPLQREIKIVESVATGT